MSGATGSADFAFEPKVWSDHIQAYFDQYLVYGAFALKNNELTGEGKGVQVSFPYFKAIGDAEEIGEDEALNVDNMEDDSFTASVFEIGKAVGFKKAVFKKSAASQEQIMNEAMRQIARRHAEKVDAKLLTEIQTSGTAGFTAAAAGDTMNIRSLTKGKTIAFGDKAKDAVVCFMHSLQLMDLKLDSTSGFLQANANDPYNMINGYSGMLLNMAIVEVDTVPEVSPVGGKRTFKSIICKENAYGIIRKQEMEMDSDKDILNRQIIVTGNEWYGVKNFDKKISSQDKKIAFLTTTTSIDA
jgi:hypothetical protein